MDEISFDLVAEYVAFALTFSASNYFFPDWVINAGRLM